MKMMVTEAVAAAAAAAWPGMMARRSRSGDRDEESSGVLGEFSGIWERYVALGIPVDGSRVGEGEIVW